MYLDDETLARIRADLATHRKPGSYEPGKWSVSAFNRDPRALKARPPQNVILRDITLRVIEQVVGVGVSHAEKLEIARAMAAAKVPSFQVGATMEGWGKDPVQLKELIKVIRENNPSVELSLFAWRKGDVRLAAELGVEKVQFGQTCLPGMVQAFLFEDVWMGRDWKNIRAAGTVDDQVSRCLGMVEAGKQHHVKVSIGVNQCSYCDEGYIRKLVVPLVDAGADEITFYDSMHGMGPDAWRYICELTRELAPKAVIGVHPHDDWGLGTASCIQAALGGATYIEVSVNGMGGPAVGQPDLAQVAAGLEVLYGVSTGIQLDKLVSMSRLVADLSNQEIPFNKPIVGKYAFNYGGGDEVLNLGEIDPLFATPVNPAIFGNRLWTKEMVGCSSGNWNMYFKLKDLGLDPTKEKVSQVLEAVKKEIRLRKRRLSDEEVLALARAAGA